MGKKTPRTDIGELEWDLVYSLESDEVQALDRADKRVKWAARIAQCMRDARLEEWNSAKAFYEERMAELERKRG